MQALVSLPAFALRVPPPTPSLILAPVDISTLCMLLCSKFPVLPPRGLLPEIDSEKARPSFVSVSLTLKECVYCVK